MSFSGNDVAITLSASHQRRPSVCAYLLLKSTDITKTLIQFEFKTLRGAVIRFEISGIPNVWNPQTQPQTAAVPCSEIKERSGRSVRCRPPVSPWMSCLKKSLYFHHENRKRTTGRFFNGFSDIVLIHWPSVMKVPINQMRFEIFQTQNGFELLPERKFCYRHSKV